MAEQLALWTEPCNDPPPANRPPTRFDLRQHEIRDLHGQNINSTAYWTAHNVPTGGLL